MSVRFFFVTKFFTFLYYRSLLFLWILLICLDLTGLMSVGTNVQVFYLILQETIFEVGRTLDLTYHCIELSNITILKRFYNRLIT